MRRRGNILSEYYDSLINLKGRTAESYMLTEKLVGIILPKSLYYIRNDILEIILDNDDNILKDNFHFDIPHYIVVSEYTKFNKNLYNLSVLDGLSIMNINIKEINIPIVDYKKNYLAYYGCDSYNKDDKIIFDTEITLPITYIDIGTDFVNGYVMDEYKGGGLYFSESKNPKFFMPINKDCSGCIILAKKVGHLIKISAFKIPFGKAIYIPQNVLHTDCFLVGKYMVIQSVKSENNTYIIRHDNNLVRFNFI